MHGKTIYERALGFELNEAPDGYILYRDGDEQVHFLNNTASIILELCDGERSVDEIIRFADKVFNQDYNIKFEVKICLSMLEMSQIVFKIY